MGKKTDKLLKGKKSTDHSHQRNDSVMHSKQKITKKSNNTPRSHQSSKFDSAGEKSKKQSAVKCDKKKSKQSYSSTNVYKQFLKRILKIFVYKDKQVILLQNQLLSFEQSMRKRHQQTYKNEDVNQTLVSDAFIQLITILKNKKNNQFLKEIIKLNKGLKSQQIPKSQIKNKELHQKIYSIFQIQLIRFINNQINQLQLYYFRKQKQNKIDKFRQVMKQLNKNLKLQTKKNQQRKRQCFYMTTLILQEIKAKRKKQKQKKQKQKNKNNYTNQNQISLQKNPDISTKYNKFQTPKTIQTNNQTNKYFTFHQIFNNKKQNPTNYKNQTSQLSNKKSSYTYTQLQLISDQQIREGISSSQNTNRLRSRIKSNKQEKRQKKQENSQMYNQSQDQIMRINQTDKNNLINININQSIGSQKQHYSSKSELRESKQKDNYNFRYNSLSIYCPQKQYISLKSHQISNQQSYSSRQEEQLQYINQYISIEEQKSTQQMDSYQQIRLNINKSQDKQMNNQNFIQQIRKQIKQSQKRQQSQIMQEEQKTQQKTQQISTIDLKKQIPFDKNQFPFQSQIQQEILNGLCYIENISDKVHQINIYLSQIKSYNDLKCSQNCQQCKIYGYCSNSFTKTNVKSKKSKKYKNSRNNKKNIPPQVNNLWT